MTIEETHMNKKKYWYPMPRFLLRLNAIKSTLEKNELAGKQLLEIGFGAGEMMRWAARKGAHVSGFDFSLGAQKLAIDRLGNEYIKEKNIKFLTSDSQIKLGSYDFVFAFEVLEHIEDDVNALKAWLSYLKPGGTLILSVPAHMSKWCPNDEWAGHFRRYEKEKLMAMIAAMGVDVRYFWNYGYPASLILDKFLNKKWSTDDDKDAVVHDDKIENSKKSGIDRPQKLIFRLLSNNFFLFPFFLLQKLFYKTDKGSGYLVHVKKPNTK